MMSSFSTKFPRIWWRSILRLLASLELETVLVLKKHHAKPLAAQHLAWGQCSSVKSVSGLKGRLMGGSKTPPVGICGESWRMCQTIVSQDYDMSGKGKRQHEPEPGL